MGEGEEVGNGCVSPGLKAAADFLSTMQVGTVSVTGIQVPNTTSSTPTKSTGFGGPGVSEVAKAKKAFIKSVCRTLDFVVLTADRLPEVGFLYLLSEGDGLCVTCAFCNVVGSGCAYGRREGWSEPCSAAVGQRGGRGHEGKTVGQAVASEHGLQVASPQKYLEHMRRPDDKGVQSRGGGSPCQPKEGIHVGLGPHQWRLGFSDPHSRNFRARVPSPCCTEGIGQAAATSTSSCQSHSRLGLA